MKYVKWKILTVTCVVSILPVFLGIGLWSRLPDTIAIHFNMYNQPDNFASKGFVVLGLPVLMLVLQVICCVISDLNAVRYGDPKKVVTIAKWIIPVMSVVLHTATLFYSMGIAVDIRCVAMLVVGMMFLILGNYTPKLDHIKNYDIEPHKARKINRFMGKSMVVLGMLAVISVFLNPVYSLIWLVLLISFVAVGVIYAIRVVRRDEKNS